MIFHDRRQKMHDDQQTAQSPGREAKQQWYKRLGVSGCGNPLLDLDGGPADIGGFGRRMRRLARCWGSSSTLPLLR
jgi:hypothetical protein